MGSKVYYVLMLALSFYVVQLCAFPRNSVAFEKQHESLPHADYIVTQKTESHEKTTAEPKLPGRIWCQYEEVTEDAICQEHCIPKGYSYGLCISNTCSCI
ncbi:uncharacterized protein LOC119188572 [Manduca sexta]|uniref:Defensin-like protein 1 n=1 Tax=Manduca sexta TaxID=7130 RepID=D1KRL1_MANSE|nr:uncharacterized protein LOC115445071 [Manduca sexta]XP_037297688.1 uncharacterized protein LOC119190282 [Manduca sexta]XP_037302523.1 uncharacterized protein LOC119188572 [Manduca sexta]ACX49766.1 defensin-like protein 1 [Manduca sexta]KAG6452548.1 hypothetical protein O3G_MSEX007682 [Manduca sexta]KAG6452549.1 hypothetical protein O3G_MSEX007682 [Manduca sexta]